MKTHLLAELPYPLIREYLERSSTIIIPFGTLEAHGKHLGVSSDTVIARHIALELARRLDFLMAPPVEYGITNSMFRYPVASYIDPAVYAGFVSGLMQSFASHGFKRIFIINGHGGNIGTLNEQVQAFAKKAGHRAVAIHWWLTVADITRQVFGAGSGHGAADETAVVTAAYPESVYPELYSEDTIYRSSPGVFAHPVPGPVIYGQDDGAPPEFDRVKSEMYTRRVVDSLTDICRRIITGWDDLDRYETGR